MPRVLRNYVKAWEDWQASPERPDNPVLTDPEVIWPILSYVYKSYGGRPARFLELGCAYGFVTGMAAFLGFEAEGYEIRQSLCDIGRERMGQYNIEAKIHCASFADAPLRDFDVVYVYPWSSDLEALEHSLRDCGRNGQLMIINMGEEGIALKKVHSVYNQDEKRAISEELGEPLMVQPSCVFVLERVEGTYPNAKAYVTVKLTGADGREQTQENIPVVEGKAVSINLGPPVPAQEGEGGGDAPDE